MGLRQMCSQYNILDHSASVFARIEKDIHMFDLHEVKAHACIGIHQVHTISIHTLNIHVSVSYK